MALEWTNDVSSGVYSTPLLADFLGYSTPIIPLHYPTPPPSFDSHYSGVLALVVQDWEKADHCGLVSPVY